MSAPQVNPFPSCFYIDVYHDEAPNVTNLNLPDLDATQTAAGK